MVLWRLDSWNTILDHQVIKIARIYSGGISSGSSSRSSSSGDSSCDSSKSRICLIRIAIHRSLDSCSYILIASYRSLHRRSTILDRLDSLIA